METDENLLAQVVDHVPIGILILRRDTTVVFANQYALDLFDFAMDDVDGKPLLEIAEKIGLKTDGADALINAIVSGTIDGYKLAIPLSQRPNMVCLLRSINIDESPDCVGLAIRDITREQEIADLIEAKEIEMAKKNTELARSNAEFKKLSELKSNFLSIASHELNTPLTSIKGYSDIIIDNMKEKVDPSVYRMIESISRAADRLHKVVHNILDVTKLEQGRLRLRPEPVDLGAIGRDCVDEISQIADKRGITFKTSVADGLPEFTGDKMRMQQMFTNLLNNAVKFSPDGASVEVDIGMEERGEGAFFHIAVSDHGIGIDESEHRNIFDSFYEVGKANRHSTDPSKFMGGGSGLGLSIVKGIVERHGGKVWVESEGTREGEFPGSTFHVALPLRSGISWDDDETHTSESRLREADSIDFDTLDDEELGKPVILIIDSDKESIEVASTAIENIFDILVAESGEQGLIVAFNQKPSLILIDSRLPGLDGYQICRILRNQEETKEIPIAFFSTSIQDDEIQKCFASGAHDFIVKPFSGSELISKTCQLLMKRKEDEVFK